MTNTPEGPHSYTLTRQSRKSVCIHVTASGVEVRAPRTYPKAEIDRLVAAKGAWITRKLADALEREAKRQEFAVSYGKLLLWRGYEYPLLGDSGSTRIWRDDQGFHLPPGLDDENLRYNVVRLYKACAKSHLAARVGHFAAIMGHAPSEIRVTDAQRRWGSCSKRAQKAAGGMSAGAIGGSRGDGRVPGGKRRIGSLFAANAPASEAFIYRINFSWRLCMADDDVIDAVVVHELAHMREMNHSEAFYAIVKSVLPDYDKRNARLKLLSERLGCENWSV
jgi:predicted metal-dependent hydrolase